MRHLLSLFTLIVLFSCGVNNEATFTITGNLPNTEYMILKMEEDIEKKISKTIDTIYPDQQGQFTAHYFEPPYLYTLIPNNQKKIPLAINHGQTILLTEGNPGIKISGSKDTELLELYERFRKRSLDSLVNSVRRQISMAHKTDTPNKIIIDSLSQLEIRNYNIHLAELTDFVEKYLASTLGVYTASLRWKGIQNLARFKAITDKFVKAHPNLAITQKVKEKLNRLEDTILGAKAPNIIMNDRDGKPYDLSAITAKYILIDFWASWCGPCRRESVLLNGLYEKYQKMGFEIIGVSLDTNKKRWLDAIEKDKRTWINLSSLEGFITLAAHNYAVTSLPNNYLLNNKGQIIAKDIHGKDLQKMIEELF